MKKRFLVLSTTLVLTILATQMSFCQKYDDEGFPVAGSYKGSKYGTGEDSVKCVTNLSLYRENYKQWKGSNFKGESIKYTLDPWRYVFTKCPLASQNTYIDGSKIIEYLYNSTSDDKLKSSYLDTLRLLYDQRIMAFGKDPNMGEAYILGRKAVELLSYLPDNYEECYKILTKSVKLAGNSSESASLNYYFSSTVKMVRNSKLDSAVVFDVYDIVMSSLDANIKRLKSEIESNPAEKEKLEKQLLSYQNSLGNTESLFEPFASCENLIKIFTPKYQANPKDIELLKKIISAFDRKKCNIPLYYTVSEALYELQPSGDAAYAMGKMYVKLEDYAKALKYLQEAATNLTDPNQKADVYMMMAEINRIQKNYSNARSNALKAAELRPNDGRPWIMIGDLYAVSAGSCGDNPVSSRAAFWAAVDKYQKAKNVDNSETNIQTAISKISTYSAYFPKSEDIFFYGFKKGDSYPVQCWINETTIIRSSD